MILRYFELALSYLGYGSIIIYFLYRLFKWLDDSKYKLEEEQNSLMDEDLEKEFESYGGN